MIFNSVTFIIFLISIVVIYWLLEHQKRSYLIFFSSLLFYSFWRIEFLPLLLLSTSIDWIIAKKINLSSNQKKRYHLLLTSIFINLSFLFFFKYLIFFTNSGIGLINLFGFNIDLFFIILFCH